MRVSEAVTETQKSSIIKAATEKLCLLAQHPRIKEMIKEIVLSSKEEKHCVHQGLFRNPRWSGTENILKLTKRGIMEETTSRDNYKYTSGGQDIIVCPPYKRGGTEKTSERLIAELEFSSLPEKYDLDPDTLQKVIDLLNK